MSKMIDLTLPIHEGMTTYPSAWHPPTEISILGRHHIEGRMTRKLTIGTHSGTHVDSPLHFIPGAVPIDEVPLETLVGRAKLIDMSHKKPLDIITRDDFDSCGITSQKGDRIVVRTDWSDQIYEKDYYQAYPSFSKDALEWIVEKGVIFLGMDTPSPDGPQGKLVLGEVSPMHYLLMSNGVVVCEYLTNLKMITQPEFTILALPLRIQGADGACARVVAVLD